jgi:hypothetical protein
MGVGAGVAGEREVRADLCPIMVELRPKRAELCAFFWGKSSVFPGVLAGFGRLRTAKCVKPQGGQRCAAGRRPATSRLR